MTQNGADWSGQVRLAQDDTSGSGWYVWRRMAIRVMRMTQNGAGWSGQADTSGAGRYVWFRMVIRGWRV